MTKTPLPPKTWLKYLLHHEKWPKYSGSLKKTKIPLKAKKRPKLIKYNLIILENDWNTPKIWKRTNIPLKPKKRPKYHWNLKKDQKPLKPKND